MKEKTNLDGKLFLNRTCFIFNKTFQFKNKRILDNNKKIRNYTEAVTRCCSV